MANFILSNTPTIEATPDYSTGDVCGGKQSISDARFTGNSIARLRKIIINDKAAQGINFDIVLFTSDPSNTTFTENAAVAVAATDSTKVLYCIPVTTHTVVGSATKQSESAGVDLPISLAASTLYFIAVIRGTGNYAATDDLTFKFVFSH